MLHSRTRFWFIVGLLATNLMVGIVGLYFLRSVNERYASLFERGVPVIYNLRTLTREIYSVQRFARQISTPETAEVPLHLVPQMNETSDRVRQHAEDIANNELLRNTPHQRAIAAVSREYDENVDQFIILAGRGTQADAAKFNLTTLRPCQDRLQQELDAASDYVEEQGRDLHERYTQESRYFGGLTLAFTSWPIAAATLVMLMLAVLVVVLFIVIFSPRLERR